MDLTKFLTQEDVVAGLELQDRSLHLALFKTSKEQTPELADVIEHTLPEGVIVDGVVQNVPALTKELEALLKKTDTTVRYVVAAIPSAATYIKLFSFPQAIQGKKLAETMQLTVGFQLPFKQDAIYLGWSQMQRADANEVLLAAAKRSIIDDYIAAITAAKLSPVAIEPACIAITRRLAESEDQPIILVGEPSNNGAVDICIIKQRIVRFMRRTTARDQKQLSEELRKLSAFYESETREPVSRTIQLNDARDREPDITGSAGGQGVWLAALGAAERGAIPRDHDMLISLMPMGTAEAYRRQRLIAFTELLSNMTVGIAFFFGIAFIGVWALMLTLRQSTADRIQTLNAIPIDQDAIALETRARAMNTTLAVARDTITQLPRWSIVLEELKARIPSGIVITNAAFPSPEETLNITGVAQDRAQLNALKKAMEDAPLFSAVVIPPANLELRTDIPFTLSFTLKDPLAIHTN